MSAAPTMFSLPNTIHEVHGTAFVRNGDSTEGGWNFGLIFARDHGCRLFACPEDDPAGGNIVTAMFSSLADMRDSLDEWLARVGMPDTVADAIVAAAPDFLAEAEIKYHDQTPS